MHLRQPFFEEVYRIDPLTEIAAYKGSLFAAEGSNDHVVGADSAQKYIAAHAGAGELWTYPMDHDFNLRSGAAALNALILATSRFFLKTLP
ncbi:hypothetical protein LJR231_000642 [Phyllobacterium sp. LjRoot231]|uniref:hypothetical protein n=1 Tax=Phyllobacterium sp. LjRoot231 TaxID=3342289 RepID=UPI003ECCA3B7